MSYIKKEITINLDQVSVKGFLCIPDHCSLIILFSHGSDSSRFSPRNQAVADYLNRHHIGTLLFDLLTPEENKNRQARFDIDLLAKRLIDVTRWIEKLDLAVNCRLAYFGASTGAASALQAAASLTEIVAVVSRGGRPDMAGEFLPDVEAPTLLLVGSLDKEVLFLNRKAYSRLRSLKKLVVIEGASHLFEEPGTLEKVEELACEWFQKFGKSEPVLH